MKLTALIGIFTFALASATDVGVTIAVDKGLGSPSSFRQASGTCRKFGRRFTVKLGC